MRREGRGEVEVSESELENVVRIGDRNEVMVKVVYPEVAEKVKKVREEVCKSKNRKRKKGKWFKEGEKVTNNKGFFVRVFLGEVRGG